MRHRYIWVFNVVLVAALIYVATARPFAGWLVGSVCALPVPTTTPTQSTPMPLPTPTPFPFLPFSILNG